MTRTVGSDFTRSLARVRAGSCPLCDRDLTSAGSEDSGSCVACGVHWWIDLSISAEKPALRTSRALTQQEVEKLYNREAEVGDGDA